MDEGKSRIEVCSGRTREVFASDDYLKVVGSK